MARLPRRHRNSVPSWVEVTTASRAGRSAEGALVKWPATTAALRSQVEINPGGVGEPFEEISGCGIRIANLTVINPKPANRNPKLYEM